MCFASAGRRGKWDAYTRSWGLVPHAAPVVRKVGIGSSVALAATPLVIQRPIASLGAALALSSVAVLARRAQVHVEVFDGRVYIQWGSPYDGPSLESPADAIAVQYTGSDAKGNGAFAKQLIQAGTRIGEYEGELLTNAEFFQRYRSGFGSHCVAVDAEHVLDGKEEAENRSDFTPAHINHSRCHYNVVRRRDPAHQTVVFFAQRDIYPGEELLINYGKQYWTGREHEELP